MFKATPNMAAEQLDRLTEDVGGFNNASTNDDFTLYYEVVPANHLRAADLGRSRATGLAGSTPRSFKSERDVVKEELRPRSWRALWQAVLRLSARGPATAAPLCAARDRQHRDLDAATIDDVRAFHATYYRPDDAALVVAGRFDPAQLSRGSTAISGRTNGRPRLCPGSRLDPARQPQSYTVHEPNTPLPAVLLAIPRRRLRKTMLR